jgi:N-formylglutamate deformylase
VGPAFTISGDPGPVVATAVHAGHELRPEVALAIALDDATRRREEDPGTELLTAVGDLRVVAHRSRFEVDFNRPREGAVYLSPDLAWGLDVWAGAPPESLVAGSLAVYDEFYAAIEKEYDALAAAGPFVVLDIHSYNHRRDGAGRAPASVDKNPEVNVGTGSLDRGRWAPVVERFMAELADQEVGGHRLDVRENVRFRGGHFAAWTHERYPETACVLAIELKKTFMDEWSGEIDLDHVDQLRSALAATLPGLRDALGEGSP